MTDSAHPESIDRLNQWLNATEGESIEFKRAANRFSFDELCQYGSALANEGGGLIILGVTDQRPRQVIGSKAFEQPERTRNGLNERLGLRTRVEVIAHPQGRVLVFTFPSHRMGIPTADKKDGRAWMRDGDKLIPLTEECRRTIQAELGHDFSADPCPDATWDDLSPQAIDLFRKTWVARLQDSAREKDQSLAARRASMPDRQLLEDVEATQGDRITYAAMVLFATRAGLRRHLANAEVIFEYRASDAAGPAHERENFQEGFFLYADRLWQLINKRNDVQTYQDGLYVHHIPTFAERPVRELLLNAISHRDYQLPGSVFIRQYPRRLVCESPGGFPPGINPENVIDRQAPRNRRIAEIFERCGLVERSGQGMDLMFSTAVREAKPLPSFDGTDAYQVVIALPGEIQDPRFVRFLEQVGRDRLDSFSTDDFLLLDLIRREQPILPRLRPHATRLRDLGIIESVGRGRGARYILSRKLYAFLGKAGQYTRQRGLDRKHNLQLLLQHLRDAGAAGAPLNELTHVVPTLTAKQISHRLTQLRDEGLVASRGHGRGARWYAVASAPSADQPPPQGPANDSAQ